MAAVSVNFPFLCAPSRRSGRLIFTDAPLSQSQCAIENKLPNFVSRTSTILRAIPMANERQCSIKPVDLVPDSSIKLLFVEMGVGYDQHGQDITSAAMRACRDAISSNSIPAFRRGSIPGVSFSEMKLQIKLGVPKHLQNLLDIEKIKSVFPYGLISKVEVVDGGLVCSSGVHVEEMGDKNDDCYIVNAAVYVGY
ncbi:uncharacterized protein LOC127247694 [Andrographis paniculata]|uniref:uncharacterized protein LOC127247694 n=1 Tax=Andrographis paniculata TaxID=175694 RepID=UPI0021E8A03E|nr:uncharacterized protein LOC127247694 [Andrographis paniculata]